MNEKVNLCHKQVSERHEQPHALQRSYHGRMISDVRVQIHESNLTM